MNFELQGKVIAITGGSDGIGKALVDTCLAHGAKVSTCARNFEHLSAVFSEPKTDLLLMKADVSVQQDCRAFIDKTVEVFGRLDVLINNAGISMKAEVLNGNPDVVKKVMDINYMGLVYCSTFALPEIIKTKGTIAGVSSVAGYRGLPGRAGYSASKFAMNGWLEALRTEMLGSGVNVLTVCPGFTKSNIRFAALMKDGSPQGETPLDESSLMSAEDCAATIMSAIQSRKRTLVFTFADKRTVWLNKLFPSLTDRLTRNFFYKQGKLVK